MPEQEDIDTALGVDEPTPRRQLFDFNLDLPEDVARFMSVLTILDRDIVAKVVADLWPSYVAGDSLALYTAEIKGLLLDYYSRK